MCMKIAYAKKMVSNIPVLASVCFMRSVYLTQFSALQEWFVKFMTRWCKKCYNLESSPKILRQLDKNEGNFILTWNSGYTKKTINYVQFPLIIRRITWRNCGQ